MFQWRAAVLSRKEKDNPMHALADAAGCSRVQEEEASAPVQRRGRVVYNMNREKRW